LWFVVMMHVAVDTICIIIEIR